MITATNAPIPAFQTLQAIEDAFQRDQGAAFRKHQRESLPNCEDAYREEDDGFRTHLGASLIGRDCSRYLWYTFHWVKKDLHEGSLLRLFNRGHLEEGRFIAILRTIGCEVWQHDENKKQFRISDFGGHFGGSLDIVIRGLLELPEIAVLTECKTHGQKSFEKLAGDNWYLHLVEPSHFQFKGEGVRKAKFEHYVQMQVYMAKMGLQWGLYFAVNKNTDELYAEVVPADPAIAGAFVDRAGGIIRASEPPKKLNESASWWQCKFCSAHDVCHKGAQVERNCRTCEHSFPNPKTGAWECHSLKSERCHLLTAGTTLDKETQLKGCSVWELHHGLK